MKTFLNIVILFSVSFILKGQEIKTYPPPEELFKIISSMDSTLFEAFNTQNMPKFKSLFTEDLEWYQDNAGLIPCNMLFETFDKNFHNESNLTREIVKGSMEVHPIKDYGAIETGVHRFRHMENGKEVTGTFKFIHLWKKTDEGWKISRVISYDH